MAQKLADVAATMAKQVGRVRKGKKNFFDVAFGMREFGVGYRFIRNIWWNKPETYWTLTRIQPCIKGDESQLRRGKAYGVLTFRGETDGQERRIRGVLKRGWRYVPADQEHVHWPLGDRKDVDMNHPRYPKELRDKYYDLV
mmetsp:Transcript_2238/g.7976  ORF Transcript_2238/g.7976 Transcript_2238/m.7976 type:complete len:141 (+) Transcript_2238:139-561(+)|eukprot:CAMPEP_0114621872 /NCGR_PEP_ID=MMETSP0168-20121206/9448_1 /TAXON_ID=95228 ORGANISM="Vannella sp., Strain DIVA3 517/6/12" /NCGR_SAMPLE_ID=MMETSP0168 /ASSEMBLY_ACC=CAM_ASM_000044 /LENGTH=140 /DNA_ID=CAMNT_0001833075 /DNA_START=122 /DNA_END=544 /DNA_ORIENTATION=-